MDGRVVTESLQSRYLQVAGYRLEAPQRITVKSHDGQYDLNGMLFLPTNLDTSKKYPSSITSIPAAGCSVGSRSCLGGTCDSQALAELGFRRGGDRWFG